MKKLLILLLDFLLLLFISFLLSKTSSIIIILIVLLVIQILSIIYQKIIIKKQKLEIQNLNYICDSTRSFRHDFNNILQAIGGYIQTNNLYDLKQYYNHLVPECFKVNNLYRFHSKLMLNTALYSIISEKYNIAEKNNIKMSLNILMDLNLLNIDTYTLTRILGILLDNAIEAASETPQKIINLSFQSYDTKQFVIVENTYQNKKVSIKKLFEKNFSTKSRNSGLGLWEVSKIIEKHKNLNLQTKAGNDFFCQKLEIS